MTKSWHRCTTATSLLLSLGCASDDADGTASMSSVSPTASNDVQFRAPEAVVVPSSPSGGASAAPPIVDPCAAAGKTMPAAAEDRAPISFLGTSVPSAGNALGIQGSLYTFSDKGGTSISKPKACGSEVCASGTTGQVIMMDYGSTWGGAIGMDLNQAGAAPRAIYDAVSGGIVGFGFTLYGLPQGVGLRFQVDDDNDSYCADIDQEGYQELLLAELHKDCWRLVPSGIHPDPKLLKAIYWFVTTSTAEAVPFNYCVSNLSGIQEAPSSVIDSGAMDAGMGGRSAGGAGGMAGASAGGMAGVSIGGMAGVSIGGMAGAGGENNPGVSAGGVAGSERIP